MERIGAASIAGAESGAPVLISIVSRASAADPAHVVKPLTDCRLYTFVDTAYLAGRDPAVVAQQLCDGGSDLIQLRAKGLPRDEVRRLAEAIHPVTQRAGVWLVINDHLDLARETGAECCHLGQEDFFDAGHTHVDEIRKPESPMRLGLSTHAPAQCARAVAAGADYVAIGPVYPTGTKPTAKPVTLEYVRWAAAQVTIPWFAIGGINLSTLDAVLAAGARRICVVSAILNAADVAAECRRYKTRLLAA
jgi:thiamine-phosphate pyrophosphorylase